MPQNININNNNTNDGSGPLTDIQSYLIQHIYVGIQNLRADSKVIIKIGHLKGTTTTTTDRKSPTNEGVKFLPGVDYSTFIDLHTALQGAVASKNTSDKWKFLERHYADMLYDGGDVTGRYTVLKPPTFQKTQGCRVSSVGDIDPKHRLSQPESSSFVIKSNLGGVVQISLRENIPVSAYKVTKPPIEVRLCKEWCYTYRNKWTYRLRKISFGPTKELACDGEIIWQVSVEIGRDDSTIFSGEEFASQVLEKAVDLLGRYDSSGRDLQHQMSIYR